MKKTLIFLCLILTLLVGCNSLQVNKCSPIYAMDTIIQISFYNDNDYKKHYDKIKEIYNLYDEISSNYESSSLGSVYNLNQNRTLEAKTELIDLINYSVKLIDLTNGYFNPYLGKLNSRWKSFINEETSFPSSDEVSSLLDEANLTKVSINENTITLYGLGDLDLGGIAKGYATQMAKEYLDSEGVTGYLINAGDSNICLGTKGGSNFKVALEKPYDSNSYITTLELSNIAIGSSSPKYQYREYEDNIYHHIINPKTGYPVNNFDSISVFTADSRLADAYSTALFSMEVDEAINFIETNSFKAILYKDNSIIYRSDDL